MHCSHVTEFDAVPANERVPADEETFRGGIGSDLTSTGGIDRDRIAGKIEVCAHCLDVSCVGGGGILYDHIIVTKNLAWAVIGDIGGCGDVNVSEQLG